jgi:hypothetical protein
VRTAKTPRGSAARLAAARVEGDDPAEPPPDVHFGYDPSCRGRSVVGLDIGECQGDVDGTPSMPWAHRLFLRTRNLPELGHQSAACRAHSYQVAGLLIA